MAFQEDAKLFGKYLAWTPDNVQAVVDIYMKIIHRCQITKAETKVLQKYYDPKQNVEKKAKSAEKARADLVGRPWLLDWSSVIFPMVAEVHKAMQESMRRSLQVKTVQPGR